jgi:hypothetical protein
MTKWVDDWSSEDCDRVAEADFSGHENLSEDALFAMVHAFAEAGSDTVHLCAGIAGSANEEDGGSDFDLFAGKRHERDSFSFDIGTDNAGRKIILTKSSGVFGNLLALDQGDLSPGRLARRGTPTEVAFVLNDAVVRFEVELRQGNHLSTAFRRMDVKGNNAWLR